MPHFSYTAVDSSGSQTTGTVEASDAASASAQIKEQGLFPTTVSEAAGPAATGAAAPKAKKKGSFNLGGGGVKSKVLTVFTRQLATLIDAGLPLLRSLKTLSKQEKNPTLRETMAHLSDSVESGNTFSEALAQHPKIFNKLYVNMVKAGELGGVLEIVLTRLAEFQEKAQRIKGKVVSAMVYPIVVLFIAIGIMAFLLLFIVPKFEKIFDEMLEGEPLPVLTQIVVDISRFVKDQFLIIGGAVLLIVVVYQVCKRTPAGAIILDRLKLKLPVFGDLITKTSIARFSRTLGTLVTSGVPILQALSITKETAGNVVLSSAINDVHESVKEGESMVSPLEASGLFPPMVISMIQVGEETGQLPVMLNKVADVYEEEVDVAVAGLTSLLEPIMIVFLALVVGTIVIALFLPLVTIIQRLTG
ncbi:MAG: type II secretion system F family protein [Verrucomicrobiota bacterium]